MRIDTIGLQTLLIATIFPIQSVLADPPRGIQHHHAAEARACQLKGGTYSYGSGCVIANRGGGSGDPVGDAYGKAIFRLFELWAKQQANKKNLPQQQKPLPSYDGPRPHGAVASLVRKNRTVTGYAADSRGRKKWPFRLTVEQFTSPNGDFIGRISWPTLSSVNKIKGSLSAHNIKFREVSYIRRGGAVLGCSYRLGDARRRVIPGNYSCRSQRGTIIINR